MSEEKLPRLFTLSLKLYEAMEAEGTVLPSRPDLGRVWVGHITELGPRAGVPTAYIGQVTTKLKQMNCVAKQYSHRSDPYDAKSPLYSVWQLVATPTMDAFVNAPNLKKRERISSQAAFEQQLRALTLRVDTLEAQLLEERVSKLERRVYAEDEAMMEDADDDDGGAIYGG
jgi:hypothetical protein